MRRVAMVTAFAAIAPLSVVGVALTATSWFDGVTMALSYLITLGVLREWSLDHYPRRALFALMVTAGAWIIGALSASSPVSFVPLSLVGSLLLARTKRRALWITVFAFAVAAVGASAFAYHPFTWGRALGYLVIPAAGTLFIAGVILISEQAWLGVRRLERAKETEAELAVARERMQFAGDLHDIQGHSLHVIKLKAALGRHLVRTDPDRAEIEFGEIRRLADETITQTRALAYARQQLNLAAELANAKRLCEAVGITVDARLDGTGNSAHPLLAQVLREATTNLLRHARPTVVTISASSRTAEVTNDGVSNSATAAETPLSGLARLRERVESVGGEMRIERPPGRFLVAARIDAVPADLPSVSTR